MRYEQQYCVLKNRKQFSYKQFTGSNFEELKLTFPVSVSNNHVQPQYPLVNTYKGERTIKPGQYIVEENYLDEQVWVYTEEQFKQMFEIAKGDQP